MNNVYNPYGYNYNNMYGNAMSNYGMSQQAANILPQQQVLQANGKASIDALRMAPNSSALIMDNTAPIVWLCTSDSIGNVTSTPYDITPHKDAPTVDVTSIEARLANVENSLAQLMEVNNNGGKSNVRSVKSKQGIGADGQSGAD